MRFITWPPSLLQKIGAAVAAVLLVIIFFSIRGCQSRKYERDLAVAEERDKQVQELAKENQKLQEAAKAEREENARAISALIEQQASFARSVVARNQATERAIALSRAPKAAVEVAKDSATYLGMTPEVQDNVLKFTSAQVQELVALKLDRDRLAENLEDTKRQLVLEQEKVTRLTADLNRFEATLVKTNQLITDQREVIQSYQKVAKRGFWRKTADVGGKVGLALVAAYIGAKVAN